MHHRTSQAAVVLFLLWPHFCFLGPWVQRLRHRAGNDNESSAALGLRNTLDLVEADIAMVDNKFIIGEGRESSTCERNNRTVGQLAAWGTRDLVPAFPDVLDLT